MKKYFLPCITAIMALAACTTTQEVVCDKGQLTVMLTGFAQSDLDSAIAIRYTAGQSFANSIDTAKASAASAGSDTLHLSILPIAAGRTPVPYPNGYLEPGFDYRLYIPRLNRWYDITNITLAGNTRQVIRHRKGDLNHYSCTNQVVSCSVNNTSTVIPQASPFSGKIFISK